MLESAFLSIMLFGWNRVGRLKAHFAATMPGVPGGLALGLLDHGRQLLDADPGRRGHDRGRRVLPRGLLRGRVQPGAPRMSFAHMWVACLETSLFVVGGVSAWYILARGTGDGVLPALLQAGPGPGRGRNPAPGPAWAIPRACTDRAQVQPAKVAAIEAHWETNKPGTREPHWNMLAWPDTGKRAQLSSRSPCPTCSEPAHHPHALTGTVPGLKDFPKD